MFAEDTLDHHLNLPARFLLPEQARLQHAGIVQHQHVVRAQQSGQVGEQAIGDPRRADVQQAAGAALRRRVLGDQVLGQIEFELVGAHTCKDNRKNQVAHCS